jgi:hypothetical protein
MPRFIQEDDTYIKYVTINDTDYKVIVPQDVWNKYGATKICDHITYWASSLRKGKSPHLKYGTYEKVEDDNNYKCKYCNKQFSTNFNYKRHCKTHDTYDIQQQHTDMPENLRIPHTQNINTQYTNNIQINVTAPREFTKENPKWLTPEVFLDAIQNITTAIPKLIKAKHFNDKYPENNNIRLGDRRDIKKRLHVFKNKRWTLEDRGEVADRIMIGMYDILDEVFHYFRGDEEFIDDEESLDETDLHNRRVLLDIQRSERAGKIISRMVRKWKSLMNEYGEKNPKLFKQLNDHFDTILLDNELKITQLKDKIR